MFRKHSLRSFSRTHKTLQSNPAKNRTRPFALLAVASIASLCNIAAASTTFINEFHYDNDGSDINEGIEIAALAGTALDNWQLLFYNGTNGSVYKIENLSGSVTEQSNGYGFLNFPIAGLQNGPADGLALIDNMGSVIEFISYEGQVSAVDGAAAGMMSIDVGVEELTNTAIGLSIQRIGLGLNNIDFSWVLDTASFGLLNSGQEFTSGNPVPVPGALWLFASALGCLSAGRLQRRLAATS